MRSKGSARNVLLSLGSHNLWLIYGTFALVPSTKVEKMSDEKRKKWFWVIWHYVKIQTQLENLWRVKHHNALLSNLSARTWLAARL